MHKIGEGRLIITSSSPNSGLRVGDGAVDLESDFLSFKELYLTSGRATVKIKSSNNINTDFVYFGSRGGTLDINGNELSFARIFASDNEANIINSSTKRLV